MAVGFRESQEFWREQAKFEARVREYYLNISSYNQSNIFFFALVYCKLTNDIKCIPRTKLLYQLLMFTRS